MWRAQAEVAPTPADFKQVELLFKLIARGVLKNAEKELVGESVETNVGVAEPAELSIGTIQRNVRSGQCRLHQAAHIIQNGFWAQTVLQPGFAVIDVKLCDTTMD